MNNCRLNSLPVELIHHLFSYFPAHEIFNTFMNISSYLDAVLFAYPYYRINFKSITKTNFDLVCQHIIPDQVISLILSDGNDTPGLVELFLSRFQINQFTRLQSLKLIEVGTDFWTSIITKLIELKNLRSFSYIASSRNDPWISTLSANEVTQLDITLFDDYGPMLPQLYRLRLCHGDFLKSIQFPHLRHLILERSSVDIIKHISSVAPQLKSLDTTFSHDASTTELIYPLTNLEQLVLRIQGSYVSMNEIERMMSNLPNLKHLNLIANCNNDVVNGERWKIKAKHLLTFKFMFNLSVFLAAEDLDSFRTTFWLEEKRWFVAYVYRSLYSVPHYSKTETNEDFQLPIYSTVPDNKSFYESVDKLDLTDISDNVNHYFTHVQTLTLSCRIFLPAIEQIVNLSRVQHLILYLPIANLRIMHLINEIPNVHQVSILFNVNTLIKQAHFRTSEKIRTLNISTSLLKPEDYNVEKLCNIFPNIEHLHVDHLCSTIRIFHFLNLFKHLSTASFRYASWSTDGENTQRCRLKLHSVLDRMRRLKKFNYAYRFDCSTVHIWIS